MTGMHAECLGLSASILIRHDASLELSSRRRAREYAEGTPRSSGRRPGHSSRPTCNARSTSPEWCSSSPLCGMGSRWMIYAR